MNVIGIQLIYMLCHKIKGLFILIVAILSSFYMLMQIGQLLLVTGGPLLVTVFLLVKFPFHEEARSKFSLQGQTRK